MPRRGRRYVMGETALGGRTTLGGYFQDARNAVNKLNDRVVAAMNPFDHTAAEVLTWLYEKHTLDVLREAFPLAISSARNASVEVGGAVLNIDLDVVPNIMCPQSSAVRVNLDTVKPLMTYIEGARRVHEAFAAVMHAIAWLDGNATPGAMRYYWPAMLSLVPPDCAPLHGAALGRHIDPEGIGALLPLLRETAGTVASALLLPGDSVEQSTGMTITFARQIIDCYGVEVIASSRSYRL